MLRDDIEYKIIELLHKEFEYLDGGVVENDELEELGIEAGDIRDFAEALLEEFILEEIEPSKLMEWKTVKDIVDYIEDNIEVKEETQIPISERW